MRFSIKTFADKPPEVKLGGVALDPERLAAVEFKAGGGHVPHVILTIIPEAVEVDIARAAVTQVEAEGAPPPANRE